MSQRRKPPLATLHVERSDRARDRIADAILLGFEHSPEADLDAVAADCSEHDAELLEVWLKGFVDLLDLPAGERELLLVQRSSKKLKPAAAREVDVDERRRFQRALTRQLDKSAPRYRLRLRLLSREANTLRRRAQVAAALRFACEQLPDPEHPIAADGGFELCRLWLGGQAASRAQLYLGWRGRAPGDWQVAVWSERGRLLAVAQTREKKPRRLDEESALVRALLAP